MKRLWCRWSMRSSEPSKQRSDPRIFSVATRTKDGPTGPDAARRPGRSAVRLGETPRTRHSNNAAAPWVAAHRRKYAPDASHSGGNGIRSAPAAIDGPPLSRSHSAAHPRNSANPSRCRICGASDRGVNRSPGSGTGPGDARRRAGLTRRARCRPGALPDTANRSTSRAILHRCVPLRTAPARWPPMTAVPKIPTLRRQRPEILVDPYRVSQLEPRPL